MPCLQQWSLLPFWNATFGSKLSFTLCRYQTSISYQCTLIGWFINAIIGARTTQTTLWTPLKAWQIAQRNNGIFCRYGFMVYKPNQWGLSNIYGQTYFHFLMILCFSFQIWVNGKPKQEVKKYLMTKVRIPLTFTPSFQSYFKVGANMKRNFLYFAYAKA